MHYSAALTNSSTKPDLIPNVNILGNEENIQRVKAFAFGRLLEYRKRHYISLAERQN